MKREDEEYRLGSITSRCFDILGQPITTNEIHEQISKLKLKKASGMDCILNEMIKHGRYFGK